MNPLKLIASLIIGFSLCAPSIALSSPDSRRKVIECLDELNDPNATIRFNAELEIIRFYQFDIRDGDTRNLILALMRLREDLTFTESIREKACLTLESQKIQYLKYLEDGKEENLKTSFWFNLRHPLRSWNNAPYRLAAFEGYGERREALKRIPLMDGSLSDTIEMLLYYQNYAAFADERKMAQEGMRYIVENQSHSVVTSALVNFIDTNPNKMKDRLIGFREDMISPFTDAIDYLASVKHPHALDYLEQLHTYADTAEKADLRIRVEQSLSAAYNTGRALPFDETLLSARRAVDEYMASSLYAESRQ